MTIKIVTEPIEDPVTLQEAKDHLRVDISADDGVIRSLIQAARETAETITRRALITQTWNYILDVWPDSDRIKIPLPPLQSVSSITYKGTDGSTSTFAASSYIVDTNSEPGQVVLAYGESWPGTALYPVGGITVQFVAGYGDDPQDVPQQIRQAMLLLIGHWYENREDSVGVGNVQRIPMGATSLLWPHRVLGF